MKVTKHQRQHRIAALLESEVVSSQPQLVEMLQAHDIDATQATVSRDLVELGAVKVRLPGGVRAFVLPSEPSEQIAPTDHLRRVLNEWVVEVSYSLNLVVVRTPPGCAHVVAAALDRSGQRHDLGHCDRRHWWPRLGRRIKDPRRHCWHEERKQDLNEGAMTWQSAWHSPTAADSTPQ